MAQPLASNSTTSAFQSLPVSSEKRWATTLDTRTEARSSFVSPCIREGLLQAVGEHDQLAAHELPVGLQPLEDFLRAKAVLVGIEDVGVADGCRQAFRLIVSSDLPPARVRGKQPDAGLGTDERRRRPNGVHGRRRAGNEAGDRRDGNQAEPKTKALMHGRLPQLTTI